MVLILGFLASAHTGWSQANEVTAAFAPGDCKIKTENELRYMQMTIHANWEMIQHMRQEALKYEGYFVFELLPNDDGNWNLRMGFKRASVVQDFYKMMLALSILKIEVDGKTYGSDKLVELCEK